MEELSEFHRRRIVVTFQHIDKLLSQSLLALSETPAGLQQPPIHDVPPSRIIKIAGHIEKIRKQMRIFLERFQIALPEPAAPSSWILKTNMASIDMALEDLYPHKMKGYGQIGSTAAKDLTQTVQEIRKQVSRALRDLAQE